MQVRLYKTEWRGRLEGGGLLEVGGWKAGLKIVGGWKCEERSRLEAEVGFPFSRTPGRVMPSAVT